MMKQELCTKFFSKQRGDALLESLIGILLLAILGLGLSYSAARMLSIQRYAATHSIVVSQMAHAAQVHGLDYLCSNSHVISLASKTINSDIGKEEIGLETSIEFAPAQCEKHDVVISAVDPDLSVTLPQAAITQMIFATPDNESARELLGSGSVVFSQ